MSRVRDLDRTIFDQDRLFRLADTGCVLELDLFGYEHAYWSFTVNMPNDGTRIDMIRALLDRGHAGHGYGHLLRNVVPFMREKGFSEAELHEILVATPRRLLTLPPG